MARGYRVRGQVQGVGFRWWTRSLALRLGLSGTVCNHPDGSVVVQAEGSDEALDALHRELLHGPPGAAVEAVDEMAAEPLTESDFRIIH